uniref:Uncharacterized protein n=1 Tax=Anguilla anguilla TaxID=7936 RepID=A0A0E9T0B7_ANGAN
MTEAAKCRNALWGMESSGPHQPWPASRYDNSHSVTQGGRVLPPHWLIRLRLHSHSPPAL